jgi:hypothetical protein
MSSFRRNLGRKQVSDKNYLLGLETLSNIKKIEPIVTNTKIIQTSQHTVGGEDLLLVKTQESATIFLNENSNQYITIKSLTNTTIKPTNSKIDEEYDELTIGKGACVELQFISGGWYVMSSDGIKMN